MRGELSEDLVGEPFVLLPPLRVGRELTLDEAPDRGAQLLVLVGEGWVGQAQSPYERPMTSNMISSVPAPMRFRRRSRHARSMPYSFM